VPNEESCGSPYVCKSMRREGKEAEASERTWSAIDLRCDVGQTRRTSVEDSGTWISNLGPCAWFLGTRL
jgi:hypothetical protein